MAASDHLHPKQLSMFMPARELYNMQPNPGDVKEEAHNRYWDSDDLPPEHTPEEEKQYMWDVKLAHTKEEAGSPEGWRAGGLHKAIAKEGVLEPVQIAHYSRDDIPHIMDGHHRVAAANDINPDMEVPIQNHVINKNWKNKNAGDF